MTCVVGFTDKENKVTWMGADSMGSNGYTHGIYDDKKVFHNETISNIIMGVCGSYRQMDLLKYSENLFPEIDKYKTPDFDKKYMVKTFIPNVKTLFQTEMVCDPETECGGNFLVGSQGKLFEIQNDYSVLEHTEGYACVGCGEVAASGSLYATTKMDTKNKKKMSPKEHIIMALEAAEKNCMGVHRPFVIVNSENDKVEVIE